MLDLEVSATFEEDFSRSFLSEFAKARDIPIYKSKTKKKTPVDSRYIVWPDKNNSKSQIGYNEVNIDEKTDLEARLERVHKVLIPLSNQNPLSMSIYSIQGKSMEAIFESEVIELLGQQVKERSIITINDKEHPVLYMRYSTQPVRYTNISDGINVKVQPISADIEQYGKIADIYEKIVSANKMGRPVDILRNCSTDCRQNFETLGEGVTREELIAYFISQGGTLIDITNPKITDIDMSNVFYNPDMNIVWKMDNHAYSYIHAVMHLNQKVPEGVTDRKSVV